MPSNTWIDRLFARIESLYPGQFYVNFSPDPDGVNRKLELARREWANSIRARYRHRDPKELAKAMHRAMEILPTHCRMAPVLWDLFGAIDEALLEMRPAGPADASMPNLPPGSGLAGYLRHVEQHAHTESSKAEVEKARAVLHGGGMVDITGMTREQHLKYLGLE